MSNERHEYEIHEFDEDFAGEEFADEPSGHPRPRGGHHHGGHHHNGPRQRRGQDQQDNPLEAIFGPDGPFGRGGPLGRGGAFGPGGFFGPQAADVARSIWENATAASQEREPWARSSGDRDGERDRRERGERHERGPRDERHRERRGGPGGDSREGRADGDPWGGGPHGHGPHGRGRGRRGPGGPGGPAFDGPRGGRGRGRRPKGDVRLAALLLIAEEARNGYQIIEELASRTSGTWRPSSGAVYPALAQLEDEGLIEAFDNDGRKAYRLTEAGHAAATEAGKGAAPWETASADASEALGGRPGGQLWQAFGQVAMAAKAVSSTRDEATLTEAAAVLDQARRALYRILADGPQDSGADPQDAAGGPQDATDGHLQDAPDEQ